VTNSLGVSPVAKDAFVLLRPAVPYMTLASRTNFGILRCSAFTFVHA